MEKESCTGTEGNYSILRVVMGLKEEILLELVRG